MIRIYGASDDLVEIEGHPDGDEVGCYNSIVIITIGTEDAGCRVIMRYADGNRGAVWSAQVEQMDEGVPIPWAITIGHCNRDGKPLPLDVPKNEEGGTRGVAYSVLVQVDAPSSVKLSWEVK